MIIKDYVIKEIEKFEEIESPGDKIPLYIQRGEDIGSLYFQFLFSNNYRDLRKRYSEVVGNPIIVGILEKESKASLYIIIKKPGEDRWREFDILIDEDVKKIKNIVKKIVEFLKENHRKIERVYDPQIEEFLLKIIDTEHRVKEGGLLIAAYVNYLERKVRALEEIVPRGWGGLVLQLMVMYFLHRRAGDTMSEMRFEIMDKFDEYKAGKLKLDMDSFELWDILKDDLIRFSHISKDSLFTLKDYEKLEIEGFKIKNSIFLGKPESLRSFRYENIKQVLKKFDKAIFGESFGKVQGELWKKFEGIGILPLFEVRNWYESGLIGDIVGGVYEGIKKIEERKKGGIYYTPRFVVEYIVDNTLDPYVKEMCQEIGYDSFEKIIKEGSVEDLERFYSKLRSIKILDPACGTGHFLIYAMEKMTRYYWELWRRISVSEGEFPVEILGEDGRKEVNLRELSEDEIPFVIRQHLILRNNIYGVDIDDYAHLIAKTRMLIEVFWNYNPKVKEKGYVMPNLEMNIKMGNSLIGFASWDEVPKEEQKVIQKTLFDDFGKGESKIQKIKRLMREAKETGDTKEYDEIITEARELMNDVYVEYLGRKGVHIEKEQLGYGEGSLRAFHWIIEFPDVFEGDNPGFDIVVGNPPYGKTEKLFTVIEKLIVTGTYRDMYNSVTDSLNTNVSSLFLYRGLSLAKNKGLLSFIITNQWFRSKYGMPLRKYLQSKKVEFIVNFGHKMVFPGATAYTAILAIRNMQSINDYEFLYIPHEKTNPENGIVVKDNKDGFILSSKLLSPEGWRLDTPEFLKIWEYLKKSHPQIKDLGIKIYYGIKTGYNEAFVIDTETRNKLISEDPKSADIIKPFIRGRNVGMYSISWDNLWIIAAYYESHKIISTQYPAIYQWLKKYERALKRRGQVRYGGKDGAGQHHWIELDNNPSLKYLSEFYKPKIIWQMISNEPRFAYDVFGFYADASIYFIPELSPAHTLIFNSNIFGTLILKTAPRLRGGYIQLKKTYLEELRIPLLDEEVHTYLNTFAYLMIFISYFSDKYREKLTLMKNLSDSIVYELYFREKFHEDGLYPGAENYLLKAVAKHLRPIDYDRWAELYWKKQIEGGLSEEEERELRELEEKNLKTIEEVYRELSEDEEVKKWVEKIKSHPWVRVIEGGGEDEE